LTGPIIVAAIFARDDFAWLNSQRTLHYPEARNQIAAHLTLFHHLPPSAKDDICERIKSECKNPAPTARISGIMGLGTGNAFRIESYELEALRFRLAEAFERILIPQDRADWYPHVTIQNKVKTSAAKATKDLITAEFSPRSLTITGLGAFHYRGGPWSEIAGYAFGSGHKVKLPSMAVDPAHYAS
jgi:2'-5' RNA ligase